MWFCYKANMAKAEIMAQAELALGVRFRNS